MSTESLFGLAIIVIPVAFVAGHMVGYFRGKGHITCPTCQGRGTVSCEDERREG